MGSMQAISNDRRDPDPDLVGLLHSPELEAELEIIDPAVLAGSGVIGKVDLDDEWFSAFDDSIVVEDGFYEEAAPSSRARAPLRLVFAFGAAATAVVVGLAAI